MMGSIATVVGRNLDTGVARESIRQWTSFRDSIWDSCSAAHNRHALGGDRLRICQLWPGAGFVAKSFDIMTISG